MKKIIALVLTGILAAGMLISCGAKFTCDFCGEEKSGKKYEKDLFGESVTICKDCQDGLNELADMFK